MSEKARAAAPGGAVVWKFNIPRNQVSTTVDIKNPKVSTAVDIKTGLGVNRRTARCQPPLTQNPIRTPEVYKPLKQNTACSHCTKRLRAVFTGAR